MNFYRFIVAFLFFERYEIKDSGCSFEVRYCFKSLKRRNHLKPDNLETPFLLSALKMPIKSVTSYQAEIKYLEDTLEV